MSNEEILQCLDDDPAKENNKKDELESEKLDGAESTEPIEDMETISTVDRNTELDEIQTDINNLMSRLDSFIAETINETVGSGDDCTEVCKEETEKQDGPPEKDLKHGSVSMAELYITDGSNPPEINWNSVGPVLQKHILDLQRLHNLNQLTISVVKRIRNMAQISEALLGETTKEAQWETLE